MERIRNQKEQLLPVNSTGSYSGKNIESESSYKLSHKIVTWITLILCVGVLVAWTIEQTCLNQPDYARAFAPYWLPILASGFAIAGILLLSDRPRWLRVQKMLLWSGLLLMVWTANGLPIDLSRMTHLIPYPVNWPGMATRTLALAAVIVIACHVLAHPATPVVISGASWYGYAAFVLALPYPVLRLCWAFGGTIGLIHPGAAGNGVVPLLFTIPWFLAAAMSLLLVSTPSWMPRRLLLSAGWFATIIVAMIGPSAIWSIITKSGEGADLGSIGIEIWIFWLFYSSWFLWAIAAGAATRSYQLRSASSALTIADKSNMVHDC